MSMTFARIDLDEISYQVSLDHKLLDPVPVDDVLQVYRAYCAHKNFHSVMPMVPGRFFVPGTEVWGYYDNHKLVAWSMYRIWDQHSVVCDHHAWNYQNPQLRLGIRSFENECAIYRDRGFRFMYFESVASYMFDIDGFKILGRLE
jgi:hypothetical protein